VGFSGAVGDLRDSVFFDDPSWRVGDPTTVTLRLTGIGNLKLLPRPALTIPWATVTTADERVTWDSTGTVVRGAKEFDWIVTPRVGGEVVFPTIRYDYFDPATRQYAAAETPTARVVVATAAASRALPPPPRDTIGDSPFPVLGRFLRENVVVVAVAILALVLLIVGIAYVLRAPEGERDD
jgi:hypothetical protein